MHIFTQLYMPQICFYKLVAYHFIDDKMIKSQIKLLVNLKRLQLIRKYVLLNGEEDIKISFMAPHVSAYICFC